MGAPTTSDRPREHLAVAEARLGLEDARGMMGTAPLQAGGRLINVGTSLHLASLRALDLTDVKRMQWELFHFVTTEWLAKVGPIAATTRGNDERARFYDVIIATLVAAGYCLDERECPELASRYRDWLEGFTAHRDAVVA